MTGSTIHQWYRFLDVRSDDEAACELNRMASRLDGAYQDLEQTCRQLAYAPDTDVDEALRVCRLGLSEAIEILQSTAARFRAGERHEVA